MTRDRIGTSIAAVVVGLIGLSFLASAVEAAHRGEVGVTILYLSPLAMMLAIIAWDYAKNPVRPRGLGIEGKRR